MQYLKDILIDIIGSYTPDPTLDGIAQIDWAWIASAVLFIGLILSFFKALRFVLGGLKK